MLALSTTGIAADCFDDLMRKGDVCYDKLQPAEALCFYLPAEKLDPNNARLLVRIARQYRHLMSDAPNRGKKVELGKTAVEYSRRAMAIAPDDPEVQLALAISLGKLLPYQSSKEQFNNSGVIKRAAEKVVALDPKNDLGWQVLGRWYYNVADVSAVKRALAKVVYGSLPSAKYEDAARCFEKAIALNPKRLMHYVELGRTCAAMGKVADARKFITKGLALPNTEKDDPETKASGREILATLR